MMEIEVQSLIAKQNAGNKLSVDEIHALMLYALDLLRQFGDITQASIDRIRNQNKTLPNL